MSKMSEIAMELDDQAVELGFESYEEAMAKGYDVCYGEEGAYLYEKKPEDEQLKAHKEWLEQKSQILTRLAQLKIYLNNKVEHGHFWGKDDWEVVADAIDFIEKGEM